ncbi:MAG: D-aminoacyl-tRNA deacylase [Chloroflexota bacterium]|jgi:D-tyrosyl-tRNA(Tyr) deacylase|nr:D-aminoacyl-tRNA deacylase [Chloroflexota bacterium]
MRLLLQRATRAEVRVGGSTVGSIGPGLVVLVGVGPLDDEAVCQALAAKTVELRIFRDEAGLTNRSLIDAGGELLAVSQFTLYADTSRGRRPSFIRAGPPDLAQSLFEAYAAAVEAKGVRVARGVFGAEMEVELVNDGPMTIWLDSEA